MPSGSHSGGGGHSGGFSGGGSWGGHSGGSHSSGNGNSLYTISSGKRNGRSVVIFTGFGGHNGRYIGSNIFTLSVVMLIFGFMLLVFGFSSMGSPAEVKQNYQHDYDYYQSMIRYAENNPEYMLTTGATITDRFIGKGGNKYYLTYEFYTSADNEAVKGYTYTTYTLEDLEKSELQVGQTIVLALNCKNTQITLSTDSIDLNYKNTKLEDDDDFICDYNNAKKSVGIGVTISIIGVALIAGSVILFVVQQKRDENPESSTVAPVQEKKKEYCKYCGALLKDGTLKCDNCGASVVASLDKENDTEKDVNKKNK